MEREVHDKDKPLLLIVDDAPANLHMLAAALRSTYRIKTALTGPDALLLASRPDMPDVILLDVIMPGMGGHEVLAQLRAQPGTRDIPVIFVTADSSLGGELRGLELGADDWLTKPVQLPVLMARVNNLLRRRRAEKQLVARELHLRTLLKSMTEVVAVVTREGTITDFHWPATTEFEHQPSSAMVGRSIWEILAVTQRERIEDALQHILSERRPMVVPFSLPIEGRDRHFETTVSLLGTETHEPDVAPSFLCVIRDVSEQLRQLAQQRLLVKALEAADNGIVITDRDAIIQWVNPAFARLTGFDIREALGRKPSQLISSGAHSKEFYQEMWATILGGQVWRGELINKRKSGELYHEELTITPVRDEAGVINHFIAVKQDVSSRKSMERELVRLANTDPLTGVANRRQLLERMDSELLRLKRYGNTVSFLMLDLDFFKKVNDRYGHAAGDQVLCHLADLAKNELRKTDLFGRMGGEEFGIVLPNTDIDQATEIAERLRDRVSQESLSFGDEQVRVTVSIGAAEFCWLDTGTETLLARADAALYRAKQAGRNRVEREKRRTSS